MRIQCKTLRAARQAAEQVRHENWVERPEGTERDGDCQGNEGEKKDRTERTTKPSSTWSCMSHRPNSNNSNSRNTRSSSSSVFGETVLQLLVWSRRVVRRCSQLLLLFERRLFSVNGVLMRSCR